MLHQVVHMQAAEEEEERRNTRPNFALSEGVIAPQPTSAVAGGSRRVPLKELGRTESILSTQSVRRNYDYSLEAAPDAHPTRKHLNTFSVGAPALVLANAMLSSSTCLLLHAHQFKFQHCWLLSSQPTLCHSMLSTAGLIVTVPSWCVCMLLRMR